MVLNDKRGGLPLYIQLYEILKKEIQDGIYPLGARIPSENELGQKYGISRITVRQALGELEKEGYVRRARGKGTTCTFTPRIDESLTDIRSFTDEMKQRGLKPGTSYVQVREEPAREEVAKRLGLEEGTKVLHLDRVRTADGEPIVFFETYLVLDHPMPLDKKAYMGSMYEVMKKAGLSEVLCVQENYSAVLADRVLADHLKIKDGAPVLKRIRIAYSELNRPVEYTISFYRGDRYSYSVCIDKKR